MFEVHLDTGQVVLCKLSGKMRENRIRVLLGDCVECEVSPYDLSKGRIIHRHKERRGVE
jgi:translation initiation factor IF-1